MAFQPEAITRLQPWSDEIAKLIEDLDTTSSEARVVSGKIGRACTLANERSGRLRERANQTTRTGRKVFPLLRRSVWRHWRETEVLHGRA